MRPAGRRTLRMMNDDRPSRPGSRPAPARLIARRFEADLSAPVLAAGSPIRNVRQISERVAMGRALWRELVIGFASQLGELRLGFTQLAALYVLADGSTLTVGELAESINRSPSATSRLIDGLVKRRLVERKAEEEDRRQKTLRLTQRGHAVLRVVDRARADQFLSAVRPLPTPERAIVAMGVAALATHAISRRGRLIRTPREE
jgi:DNA-binding MarR family transcriptional regulator